VVDLRSFRQALATEAEGIDTTAASRLAAPFRFY